VIVERDEGEHLLGLQIDVEQAMDEIALSIVKEGARRQLWRGRPPMPGAIVLSAEETGPGPAAIPFRIESSMGTRDYTLFVPVMARLGQSSPVAPAGQFRGDPLSRVLASYSALTGLVLLAEEPLSARVCAEIPAGTPSDSLEKMVGEAGFEVQRNGDIALTLTHRRSAE
jgi:hypothetical protein